MAIIARVAIIALIAAVALAGCGSTAKSDSTTSRVAPQQGVKAPALNEDGGGGGALAELPTPPAPTTVARSIIYNGTITVRVTDVNATAAQVQALATTSGGYLGGDDRQIDASRSSATLILRVPAARFDATVDAIGNLGKEQDRNVSTEDVTAQVIDVQSRIKTQQASVNRVRALLAQARSLSEIVSIEGELTRREADLESLQARIRSLTDLTSLSTITATLLGPEASVTVADDEPHGFVNGLKSGWHAFQLSLSALLTIIGALLPFVIVIGGPLLLILWLARHRRARRPAPVAMTSAPQPVAGALMTPTGRPVPRGPVPPSGTEPVAPVRPAAAAPPRSVSVDPPMAGSPTVGSTAAGSTAAGSTTAGSTTAGSTAAAGPLSGSGPSAAHAPSSNALSAADPGTPGRQAPRKAASGSGPAGVDPSGSGSDDSGSDDSGSDDSEAKGSGSKGSRDDKK